MMHLLAFALAAYCDQLEPSRPEQNRPSASTTTSRRSFDTSIPQLADAGSCPGNCGFEKTQRYSGGVTKLFSVCKSPPHRGAPRPSRFPKGVSASAS